jgi:hypothetical protein
MTLDTLKEEYKKSIGKQISDEDYDQLIEEIDDANTLEEFIQVVHLWATDDTGASTEKIILKRILQVN